MRPFIRKKEQWILLAVLLVAAAGWFLLRGEAGGSARLTFASGAEYTVNLSRDCIRTYQDGSLPVTVQVQDGRCRIIRSVCPDHICESFGWLSQAGQSAVCVPAGAVLLVVN